MLVAITPHFWQQTQKYIPKKLGENAATEVLIGLAKMTESCIFDKIVDEIYFFLTNEK